MNRNHKSFLRDSVLCAMSGFMVGVSFTTIAFHFNHKNILGESLYVSSAVLLVFLILCLKTIFKKAM
jgi:hypothetical protein